LAIRDLTPSGFRDNLQSDQQALYHTNKENDKETIAQKFCGFEFKINGGVVVV